jgi:hypothetical protein
LLSTRKPSNDQMIKAIDTYTSLDSIINNGGIPTPLVRAHTYMQLYVLEIIFASQIYRFSSED